MIAPNKSSIYFDKMPSYVKLFNTNRFADNFVEYMTNNTDIKIVFPKEELLKYKNKYQLYYRGDTHWNNIGAYIGYSQLMKKLSFNVTNIEDINLIKVVDVPQLQKDIGFFYDIVKALHLRKLKLFNNDIEYLLDGYTNFFLLERWNNTFYNIEKSQSNNNSIFFIRDSFTQAMIDYIIKNFYKSYFVSIYNFNNSQIVLANPNIVVLEIVEKNFLNVVLNIIKTYEIEKINDDNLFIIRQ